MAEFVIVIRDPWADADPYTDIKRLKRGDIIDVLPDGWQYSAAELSNPNWRIVRVAGITEDEARAYLAPEVGDSRVNHMLRPRAFFADVDFATLPQVAKNFITDDARTVPVLSVTLAQIRALKTLKTPASDPNVIG